MSPVVIAHSHASHATAACPLCGVASSTILRAIHADFARQNAHFHKEFAMSRSGAVTFKGTPLTLAGEAVKVGQQAPDFTVHYFDGGLKTIKLSDLKGKP